MRRAGRSTCEARRARARAAVGAVAGHRVRALGVERFGQTGTVEDLYRHVGMDAEGIVRAAEAIAPGRPIRHLRRVV